MSTLLHLSDPHFGCERPAVVAALRRLSEQLQPDVLVLSGDCTQRARAPEFSAARAFVDSLGIRSVLVIPGNHDLPLGNVALRLFNPYARHRRAFGPSLEPLLDTAEWLVQCVNTTRWWRHEDGDIAASQVEQVTERLAAAGPEQLRIVVTHQPVAVTRPQDAKNALHGGDAAIAAWARAGCDLILGGHIHLPFVLALHERDPDLPRRVWAVQAGTAVSTRLRHEAGNSVNVIRRGTEPAAAGPGARLATVERWDYRDHRQRFECQSAELLVLGPG